MGLQGPTAAVLNFLALEIIKEVATLAKQREKPAWPKELSLTKWVAAQKVVLSMMELSMAVEIELVNAMDWLAVQMEAVEVDAVRVRHLDSMKMDVAREMVAKMQEATGAVLEGAAAQVAWTKAKAKKGAGVMVVEMACGESSLMA